MGTGISMPVESVPLPIVPVDVGRAGSGGPRNDTDGSEWRGLAQPRMDAPTVDWVGRSLDRPAPIRCNHVASLRCAGYGFDQLYDIVYDFSLQHQIHVKKSKHSIKLQFKSTQAKYIRQNNINSMEYLWKLHAKIRHIISYSISHY